MLTLIFVNFISTAGYFSIYVTDAKESFWENLVLYCVKQGRLN